MIYCLLYLLTALTHTTDVNFPPAFLELAGLSLPNSNGERIAGFDINPGSDHGSDDEEEEDYNPEEEDLNNLGNVNDEAAEVPAAAETNQGAPARGRDRVGNIQQRQLPIQINPRTMSVPNKFYVLQLNRVSTDGMRTRDLVSCYFVLPPGVQLNTAMPSIQAARDVKIDWQAHPSNYDAQL